MKDRKTEQVYRWALQYIEEHRFSNETKMPSENAAKRLLEVSRQTVHVAYDQLEAEGYIERRQGSGTYIRKEKALTGAKNQENTALKIGLILQGRATSPSDIMIDGMKSVFSKYRAELHVYLTDNQFFHERRLLQTIGEQGYAGFIVDGVKSSFITPNMDVYKKLYRRKMPIVFYNNYYRDLPYPRDGVNNEKAAELLMNELITKGHRNLAGIFVYDNIQSIEKFQGMLSVLYRRNIEFPDDHVKWLSSDEVSKKLHTQSIRHFLKEIPRTTAIVCCNYRIYTLVRKVLDEQNLSVPEDYSVVCFDYTGNDYQEKGITCTVHRGYDLGVHIAEQFIHMIKDQDINEQQYSYKMSPLLYVGTSVRSVR